MLTKVYLAKYPIKSGDKTYGVGEVVPESELTPHGIKYLKLVGRIEETFVEVEEKPFTEIKDNSGIEEVDAVGVVESENVVEEADDIPEKKSKRRGRKPKK